MLLKKHSLQSMKIEAIFSFMLGGFAMLFLFRI